MEDYIKFVVGYGKRLEEVKSRCRSIDAFVRRAKDFPSLVAQEGLVPAMTFYYSKAEGRALGLEAVKDCEEFTSEGRGYSVYLGFLIEVLKRYGNLKCERPLDCILEVRGNEVALTRLIMPVLVEMKKVAEIVEGE